MREVWIRGAAMTPFGKHVERSARDLVEQAVAGALADAELRAGDVQFAYVANALAGIIDGQECMRAQTVLRRTGLMGVPMVSVENADCSGSTALHMAWQAVAHEVYDCVVVVGYEKFDHRDRARSYRALNSGMDLSELSDIFGPESNDRSVQLQYSGAHSAGDGSDIFEPIPLAEVSVKNHYHASLNPCAHYREPLTVEQVLASRQIAGPLTQLMCAPLSDGAACLVVCAGGHPRGRRSGGARIAASVLRSGRGDDLTKPWSLRPATARAYETAGFGPEDLDVAEVHDMTAIAELFVCAELGFYRRGEADRVMAERETWLGGRLPVNPSGGLLARGHPLGATGVAQVVELTWQLEGRCGPRQVESARAALADNIGGWIGSDVGAGVTHILVR